MNLTQITFKSSSDILDLDKVWISSNKSKSVQINTAWQAAMNLPWNDRRHVGNTSLSTAAQEFQPRISKKEKKDSGRHFGWPFWPMQAGPGRPPHPGGEEAAAGQELWGGAASTVVVAAVDRRNEKIENCYTCTYSRSFNNTNIFFTYSPGLQIYTYRNTNIGTEI